jgi:tetratricopeptide (TPR) repeat protein
LASDSVELGYNKALTDDSLGHYDEAAQTLQNLVKQSSHPDGQYSDGEKNNRSIFLDRLANVYKEQQKTDQAVQTYQLMVAMGGDYAERGYQAKWMLIAMPSNTIRPLRWPSRPHWPCPRTRPSS